MAEDIAVGEWGENATLRYKDLTDEIKKRSMPLFETEKPLIDLTNETNAQITREWVEIQRNKR